ncbi:MAG: sigma-54-dependent Fis family transcriptional regulator [SAR324 cluster bacterium]|nr:sigma-54-dependent Fis family transcriptional regulator [SAR324 cluster bacterium]
MANQSRRPLTESSSVQDEFWNQDVLKEVHTRSPQMLKTFEKVKSVAPTKTTVLLQGDTGVGKGMVAKLIHQHSSRKNEAFVHVHCGALPETLVESELFGYEKGAFTGAVKRKLGRFDNAQRGTIFLDEINTISGTMQIKLLQVLQERIFQRVGGEAPIESDVRVIAASNSDLQQLCDDGYFRKDLYYRLSVFPLEIPSLHQRSEDIPEWIDYLIDWFNRLYFKEIQGADPLVVKALVEYSWPGNIRELENVIERAYILETTPVLMPESFPQELFSTANNTAEVSLDITQTLAEVRRQSMEQLERQYLKELLRKHQGRINRSAETAGITTRQLHKLLRKHVIRKEEFKPAFTSSTNK